MGSRDLPDMYALGPAALGLQACISGKSLLPMLQLILEPSNPLKSKTGSHFVKAHSLNKNRPSQRSAIRLYLLPLYSP